MEENYLIGLILTFLFGFVFFKKDTEIKINTDKLDTRLPIDKVSPTTSTSVAKYLQAQQGDLSQDLKTGVSKYLESKHEQVAAAIPSGVAKYLASKNEVPVSGVSKYMARKSIHAKEIAKKNISSVEKYLKNQGE